MEMAIANKISFYQATTDAACYFSWGFAIHYPNAGASGVGTSNWKAAATGGTSTQAGVISSATTFTATNPTSTLKNTIIKNASGTAVSATDMAAQPSFTSANLIFINANSITDGVGSVAFPPLAFGFVASPGTGSNVNAFHFMVLNSCVKWAYISAPFTSPITSVYNYIDIQLNVVESIGTATGETKMNRFFKFITDSYVLDHRSNNVAGTGTAADTDITLHIINNTPTFTAGSIFPNWYGNGICMVQIAANFIASTSTPNTMIVYLSHMQLLEMDPTDIASTYPVNGKTANVNAYGLTAVTAIVGHTVGSNLISYPWYQLDYVGYGPLCNGVIATGVTYCVTVTTGATSSVFTTANSPLAAATGATALSSTAGGLPIGAVAWGNFVGATSTTALWNQLSAVYTNIAAVDAPPRSVAKLFMSNALWINAASGSLGGSSGQFPSTDILFPVWCPNYSGAIGSNYFYHRPLVQINFVSATGLQTITTNNYMWVPLKSTATQNCSTTTPGATDTCGASYWQNPSKDVIQLPQVTASGTAITNPAVLSVLRINAYTITTSATGMNYVYICPNCTYGQTTTAPVTSPITASGTGTAASITAVNCSGFNLFINDAGFAIDSSFTAQSQTTANLYTAASTAASTASGTPNNISFRWDAAASKYMYVLGNKYNHLQMNAVQTSVSLTLGSATAYYVGLTRPATPYVVANSSGVYSVMFSDQLAFYCVDKTPAATIFSSINTTNNNLYLTNYLSSATSAHDSTVGSFIVDWPTQTALTASTTTTIAKDSSYLYASDAAGTFTVTVKLAVGLTQNSTSSLVLNMLSVLGANSNCGINYPTSPYYGSNSSVAEECTNSSGVMTCKLTGTGTAAETGTINICCQGATFGTTDIAFPAGTPGSTSTASLTVAFTNQPSAVLTNVYYLAPATTPTALALSSGTTNPTTTTVTAAKPTLSITTHPWSSQDGAYGKVTFNANVGREIVRNSNIVISGDFSVFTSTVIGNTRCMATFITPTGSSGSQSSTLYDRWIESCSFSLASSGTITVRIGARTVQCGVTFPKIIYVSLWPVVAVSAPSSTLTTSS